MTILMVALSGKFELWRECLFHNAKLADKMMLRFDGQSMTAKQIADIKKGLPINAITYISNLVMDKCNWRQEMLDMVVQQFEPQQGDWILFPDEDEKLPAISYQGRGQMLFTFDMPTDGHGNVFVYPALPHTKAFSYESGLSYEPYLHCARVTAPIDYPYLTQEEKVQHYCFYRKHWFDEKVKSIKERYPDYFVMYPKKTAPYLKTLLAIDQVYDANYFGARMAWKPPVYKAMAEEVKRLYTEDLGTVIELGCGNGEFLQHFPSATGIEGAQAGIAMCSNLSLHVWHHDLRKPFDMPIWYDMAISIEVAEHIEPDYVDVYVANLKAASGLIILTASPYPSEYHLNPQPRQYWIDKMGDQYTENSEALRNAWKAVIPTKYDYLWKNLMVFERSIKANFNNL
jgi:hypothetical protein